MLHSGAQCAAGVAERPRLSVIVPAHNAGRHLSRCIDALDGSELNRADWELIVVDDASTDDTASIAGRADRIVATGDKPKGPAFARNRGADVALGEILVFVDADVAVHRDVLGRLVSRLDEDVSLVAVFGSYDEQPAAPSVVSRYRNLLHRYAHTQSAGKVTTFWAGCGAVRATAFREVGGFDAARYLSPQIEDIELGYRLRRKGEILLDPDIEGTHHKQWTIASIIRTDLLDRAIPWVRLILSRNPLPSGTTPSLGPMAAVVTALTCIGLTLLLVGGLVSGWPVLLAGTLCLLASILLNFELYQWLRARGGAAVAAAAVPFQMLYQVISAIAVPIGTVQFLLSERTPRSADSGIAPGLPSTRFLSLALGETAARVVAFAATAYLARKLGASGFGQIAFALAVVSHFGIALTAGVGELSARDVARDPHGVHKIVGTAIALRLILASFAIVAIFLVASVLHIDETTRNVTWLYSFAVIPFALDTNWAYKGLGRTNRVAIALVLAQLVSLVLIIMLVTSRFHVSRVPLIQVAADSAAALFLLLPLMRGRWLLPSIESVRTLARQVRIVTVSRMMRTVIVSFDVVLLGLMVSNQQVGLYSAAYRIVFFVMAILYAAQAAFVSDIARARDQGAEMSAVLSRAIALGLLVTIPFAVGAAVVAGPLIGTIFGEEYVDGAVALKLLLVGLVLLAMHGATRNVFLSIHRNDVELRLIGAGVVTNIILTLLLIPRYGINGAALATVGGEAAILLGVFTWLYRHGIRPSFDDSLTALFGGTVMGVVLVAVGPDRPPIQLVIIGGFVYTFSIAAFTLVRRRRDALVPEA